MPLSLKKEKQKQKTKKFLVGNNSFWIKKSKSEKKTSERKRKVGTADICKTFVCQKISNPFIFHIFCIYKRRNHQSHNEVNVAFDDLCCIFLLVKKKIIVQRKIRSRHEKKTWLHFFVPSKFDSFVKIKIRTNMEGGMGEGGGRRMKNCFCIYLHS